MTDRDALSLGIKITGFAWLLHCVNDLYKGFYSLSFMKMSFQGEKIYSQSYPLRFIGIVAIAVLVTIIFLAFSDKLSQLIVNKDKALSENTAFGAAVALIGIVFVSLAIESLFASVMEALWIGENRTTLSQTWNVTRHWAPVVQHGVILLLGVYLACCRNHIVYFVDNWRKHFFAVKNFFTLKECDS